MDMLLGLHEPNTFEVARQLIRKGMVVVDIGAHIGYFTIYFNQIVGPGGAVYAFEPNPETFVALERIVAKNRCQQVVTIRKAAGKDNSQSPLFLSRNPYMSSLNSDWAGAEHGRVTVETVNLDSFFNSVSLRPDFIKLDVEGGGVFALPGMESIIKRYAPILYLESHTPEEDRAIGQALSLSDYAVFRIGNRIPVKKLTADYRDMYGIYESVVGVPRSRQHLINQLKPERFQRWRFGQRPSMFRAERGQVAS